MKFIIFCVTNRFVIPASEPESIVITRITNLDAQSTAEKLELLERMSSVVLLDGDMVEIPIDSVPYLLIGVALRAKSGYSDTVMLLSANP